ncbi:MAG TPA: thermonuclease family protein [Rhizomicrobium sp.]|nr:thermonuclease family protein [Rhizomicrobium sp.]
MPNIAYASDYTKEFQGPVTAHVDRVIDGDTFEASAAIWLGQQISVRVRIQGVDAPELRARCDSERSRAEAARDWLSKRIEGGDVKLSAMRYDKYGGRIDAAVTDMRGDIGESLVRAGMARLYDGGHRDGWCG